MSVVSKISCKCNQLAPLTDSWMRILLIAFASLLPAGCVGTAEPPPQPVIPDPLPAAALNPPTPMIATRPGEQSVTPAPVCTPPPCAADEQYFCPGDCPGGCGTICVTPTRDGSVPVMPTGTSTETAVPPSPTATNTPLPTPTATVDLSPLRIQFLPGTTSTVQPGTLGPGQSRTLTLNARSGQLMVFALTSANAPIDMTMTYPGTTLFHRGTFSQSDGVYHTGGTYTLPQTGDYAFLLTNVGTAVTDYTITFSITDTDTSGSTPERVQFLPGTSSATLVGELAPAGGDKSYLLTAVGGQVMRVQLLSAGTPLFLSVSGPDGQPVAQQTGSYRQDLEKFESSLALTLPASGDYLVTLSLIGAAPLPTEYEITFSIQ